MRQLFREDFWSFFLWCFGAGSNPSGDKWIDEEVHYPLAQWFQQHVDQWFADRKDGVDGIGKARHLVVLVHRGVGKTTMITRAGQLWLHLRDPEIATATGAENMKLSNKMLEAMKAVLDGSDQYSLFARLYGNWSASARKWTGTEIVHAARRNTARQDPSFITFAVETSITGSHPDAVFYDDPISYERLSTDTNWLGMVNSQLSSLVPVIQSDGLTIWVGTRYDDDDHFGTAFKDEGIASLTGLETEALHTDPDGHIHVYFLAGRDKAGLPTTPKVWPERELKKYQKRDPLRYASQVMNDPTISEFNPLTKDQIRQCVVPSKAVPWNALRFGICCDTAFFTGESRSRKDHSVYIIHGYPRDGSGDVYIVEVHGSPLWRAEDMGRGLVSAVQRYRRQGRKMLGISDEIPPGKAGGWKFALQNFFSDAGEPMPPFFEYNRQGSKVGGKVQRIIAASTFWVDGHVKVVEEGPGVGLLMEQMAKVGQMMVNPKMHDDYADAHADAFQPDFYSPMKRAMQPSPWERGAQAIHVDGMNPDEFEDDATRAWEAICPRPPMRSI